MITPKKAVWSLGSAKLVNTKLKVTSTEALELTLVLFTFMRWLPVTGRVPREKEGKSYILYDPESMMEIQLEVDENPQGLEECTPTFILGLRVDKPLEAMAEIRGWCTNHQQSMLIELVENTKQVIKIPQLFSWGIMFVESGKKTVSMW